MQSPSSQATVSRSPCDEPQTDSSSTAITPVLILLHGAGANHAMWNPVRRHLAPRFQTVALDLPGHGSRGDSRFTLSSAVETVVAEVQRVAPAPVVLVGDSLGGYTSIASAAAIDPKRLMGLVLGGCSQNIDKKTLRALRRRKWLIRIMGALFGESRLVAKSASALVEKGIDRQDVDEIVAAGMRLRGWGEAVDSLADYDALMLVRRISAPVLFINGERDVGPISHEAEFVAAAQDARAEHFPCDHGASLWMPSEFASATNRFIEHLLERPIA